MNYYILAGMNEQANLIGFKTLINNIQRIIKKYKIDKDVECKMHIGMIKYVMCR